MRAEKPKLRRSDPIKEKNQTTEGNEKNDVKGKKEHKKEQAKKRKRKAGAKRFELRAD
jgi:hypothetical protein